LTTLLDSEKQQSIISFARKLGFEHSKLLRTVTFSLQTPLGIFSFPEVKFASISII